MTFTFKLEQADGTPADPPTMQSTRQVVTGDAIPHEDRRERGVSAV